MDPINRDRVALLPVADNSSLHPLKVLSIGGMCNGIDIGCADRNDMKKKAGTITTAQCSSLISTEDMTMGMKSPKEGAAGTTDQSPRWEGPQENTPRGYLPAKDDPDTDRDAVGETNADPLKRKVTDAMKTKGD